MNSSHLNDDRPLNPLATPVGEDGGEPDPPAFRRIIDDSDGGTNFQTTGTWRAMPDPDVIFMYPGNYNGTQKYTNDDSGFTAATWRTTGVPAGDYKIYAAWNSTWGGETGDGWASSSVKYGVFDNATQVGFKTVDQRKVPKVETGYPVYYDLIYDGVPWKLLGTFSLSSGTVQVSIIGSDGTGVFADAVMIVTDDGIVNVAGSGSRTRSHPTLAGTGQRTPPGRTGSGSRTRSHPTIAGSGGYKPKRTGSGSRTRSHPTITGSGSQQPGRTASGALGRSHAAIIGLGETTDSAPSNFGAGAVNSSHAMLAGDGLVDNPPNRTGSGTPGRSHPSLTAAAVQGPTFAAAPAILRTASTALGAGNSTPPAFRANNVGPTMLAHWPLREGSGTTATDAIGGEHAATLEGGAAWELDGPGEAQSSIRLGGAAALAFPQLRLGSAFAVSFWLKLDVGPDGPTPILESDNGPAGVRLDASRRITVTNDNGGVVVSPTALATGAWNHVVVAKETNGYLRIVVNGASTYYGAPHATANFAASRIGGGASPLLVADFRVYARPLSILQAIDLMAGVLPSSFRPTRSLRATGWSTTTTRTGSATPSRSKTTLAATGRFTEKSFLGASAPSRSHPLIVASGSRTAPVFTGVGSAAIDGVFAAALAGGFMPGEIGAFIRGSTVDETMINIPMVVTAADAVSAAIDLVTPSAVASSGFGIQVVTMSVGDVNVPIGLNLVVKSGVQPSTPGSIPCSILGGDNAFALALPMVVRGGRPRLAASLNLATLGIGAGEVDGRVNVVTLGGGPRITQSIPIWLESQVPTAGRIRLFTQGPDGTPGAIPIAGSMSLFCEWGVQGVVNLICGPGVTAGPVVDLITLGREVVESAIDMTIAGEGGVSQELIELILPNVHAPTQAGGSINLATPNVKGLVEGRQLLFVNGWGV